MCRLIAPRSSYQNTRIYIDSYLQDCLILPGAELQRDKRARGFCWVYFYPILISTEEDQDRGDSQIPGLTSTTSARALKPTPSWMMPTGLVGAVSLATLGALEGLHTLVGQHMGFGALL